jgi:transcriptional regulator with XRE-family HTH domain
VSPDDPESAGLEDLVVHTSVGRATVLPAAGASARQAIAQLSQEQAIRTAQWLDGERAGAALAVQLRLAWVGKGKPRLADLGDQVGYSKATISKVLSGKMPPAWRLVRKLGAALGISESTVNQEWHPMWIAADKHRHEAPGLALDSDPAGSDLKPPGHVCPWCGGWVVNTQVHVMWHMQLQQVGQQPAPTGAEAGRIADAYRWASLRDALGPREK